MKNESHGISEKKTGRRGPLLPIACRLLYDTCRAPRGSQGQAIFIAAVFFLVISLTMALGVVTPVLNAVSAARALARGAQGLYAAEGASQDVMLRLIKGMPVDTVETLDYGGGLNASATTTSTADGRQVVARGTSLGYVRTSVAHLLLGDGAAFNYGIQVGQGGFELENSSRVFGNVYSNGLVEGAGNAIYGTVVSAGPLGRISDVHATSSAYAHRIENSTVDRDAYYQTLVNTTVLGTLHPGSADQATTSLPIADSVIADLEAQAAAGGVVSSPCPYKIQSDAALGPKKIACDLEISGNPTVTLNGPVWVTGDITIKNSPTIKISSLLAGKSVALIADNPSDRLTSSEINSNNTATFVRSATSSYVALISQNASAEKSGKEIAILVANSTQGDFLVYAPHGRVTLQNGISLKAAAAYLIELQNTASVHYETGLQSALFTSGPGGGYIFDYWQETE